MNAWFAAVRAIHFASLMLVFGGSAYALLLQRAGLLSAPVKGVRALFVTAATLAILSAIVWFSLTAGQIGGEWGASLDPATLKLVASDTRFGHVFIDRFLGLAALWLMCALGMKPNRLGIAALAGLLLASLAPVSHAAAAADVASFSTINDAAHLLAAGFWLGALVMLVMVLQQHWQDHDRLVEALRIFSLWGGGAVAMLAATGLLNAVSILPMFEVALGNRYFRLLLVKVGLAGGMIALAALNRWRLVPALGTGEGATRGLAASVWSEIALGFTVVAIVGLLGIEPPN